MKNTNVTIRLSKEQKEILKLAAFYENQSLSSYIRNTVLHHVESDLHGYKETSLSGEEWNKFIHLLDNPPEPNEALKSLFH